MIIQTAKWHHGHRRSDKSSARLLQFTTLIIGIIDCLVVSVRVSEALQQVGAGGHWRVSAGAVTAADQSFIVRLEEEGQRLTCAGVSYRGQQNSVELNDRTTPLFLVSNWISIIHDTLIKPTVCIDYCYSVVVHILPSFSELYFWPCKTNTRVQTVPWTHHRDKLVAGPALHQVGDVDEDGSGDDGNSDVFTWAAAHLHIHQCICGDWSWGFSRLHCLWGLDREEALPADPPSSETAGWCCRSLNAPHSAAGPPWLSHCLLEGSTDSAALCHSRQLQETQQRC